MQITLKRPRYLRPVVCQEIDQQWQKPWNYRQNRKNRHLSSRTPQRPPGVSSSSRQAN